MYDVNKRSTFESYDYWLNSFREVAQETTIIILVGNQVDRCQLNEDLRKVSTEEGQTFA